MRTACLNGRMRRCSRVYGQLGAGARSGDDGVPARVATCIVESALIPRPARCCHYVYVCAPSAGGWAARTRLPTGGREAGTNDRGSTVRRVSTVQRIALTRPATPAYHRRTTNPAASPALRSVSATRSGRGGHFLPRRSRHAPPRAAPPRPPRRTVCTSDTRRACTVGPIAAHPLHYTSSAPRSEQVDGQAVEDHEYECPYRDANRASDDLGCSLQQRQLHPNASCCQPRRTARPRRRSCRYTPPRKPLSDPAARAPRT